MQRIRPANDMNHALRRLDKAAIWLSGLCVAHCVLTVLLVAVAASAASALLHPAIHEIGLIVAIVFAVIALGIGAVHHRRPLPLTLGVTGIGMMTFAVVGPHGIGEALFTVAGVTLLVGAHLLNRRALA